MNLKELIQKLADKGEQVYTLPCKVTAVDESKRCCDVEPLNGDAEIFDVRLQANFELTEGICLIPKVGSEVLVTFINKQTGYVALFGEVEKVLGKFGYYEYTISDQGLEAQVGQQKFSITSSGVKIDGFLELVSGANGLKQALDKLLDDLATATLTTTSGPSTGTFDPQVIAKFQAVKTQIATFLK